MTTSSLRSPLVGTVVAVKVAVGDVVSAGTELVIIESMKMEHPVAAETSCRISALFVTVGKTVNGGEVLVEYVAERYGLTDLPTFSVATLSNFISSADFLGSRSPILVLPKANLPLLAQFI